MTPELPHRVNVLWSFMLAFGLLWLCGYYAIDRGKDRLALILFGAALLCFVAGITANLW